MKLISTIAIALLLTSCGSENKKEVANNNSSELVEVEDVELPKAIVLITDLETKEVTAHEIDAELLEGKDDADLTDAEKELLIAGIQSGEIPTKIQKEGFSLNEQEFAIPQKTSVQWFYGGGFFGYGFGFRFPYAFGFGYPFGGFGYGFFRPAFGFGYGYFW